MWPGMGGKCFVWSTPQDNSVGSGVVWVTGLFSLWAGFRSLNSILLDLVSTTNVFSCNLLIMVMEIRFKFQICVPCAEKAMSKIIFNIRWNLQQILRLWHTWVSKADIKRFQEQWDLSVLISAIRPGLEAWPGVGGSFFTWSSSPD